MKNTVLFDLGGTLARYFERSGFPDILKQAITKVQNYLRQKDLLSISTNTMWRRVREEDHEAKDHRVRPLEERLVRIFQLGESAPSGLVMTICRCFMKPIFARGRCYEDALPTLRELRSTGFKMAIVSNTAWGSPAALWREEIKRLGLDMYVDVVVFCRDVGWRKPAKQIFEFALEKLQVLPQHCVFIGDDPRWDLVGPRAVGIETVLIDRRGVRQDAEEETIKSLYELPGRLQLSCK
jgi:putative hydrolase of the HAD superfamily